MLNARIVQLCPVEPTILTFRAFLSVESKKLYYVPILEQGVVPPEKVTVPSSQTRFTFPPFLAYLFEQR